MPSCLIVNPVSNANILVNYLRARGVDCYALIELDKVSQIPKINTKKRGEFQAKFYKEIFTSEEQLPPCESRIFDAVLPGSENGVFLAEKLAAKYSLVGNAPTTSSRRRYKDEMQRSLKNAGLNFIPTTTLHSRADVRAALLEWDHYPCVLKPQSSAGGEGVKRCDTREELQQALDSASWGEFSAAWTINDCFLIQPMVQGGEYVVDLVASAGNYFVAAVCRYVRSDELGITSCDFVKKFTFALPLASSGSKLLIDYAKLAAKALDITYGAVHMELVLGENGPVMIEAAARMHGTVTPKLFTECYQSSLLEQLYEAYFGNTDSLRDAVLISPAVVSDVICIENGVCTISDPQIDEALAGLRSLKGYSCGIDQGAEYVVTHDLFSSPMNACFCDTDVDQLWADVVAFEQFAENFFGGQSFNAETWQSIRMVYDDYLTLTTEPCTV